MRYYQIASLLLVPAVLLCTGCRRNPNISTEANSLVDQWMADETTAPKEPDHIAKNDIDDGAGIVRTQVGNVAEFTKMHFDGDKFVFHIDLCNAGGFDESFEFGRKSFA